MWEVFLTPVTAVVKISDGAWEMSVDQTRSRAKTDLLFEPPVAESPVW